MIIVLLFGFCIGGAQLVLDAMFLRLCGCALRQCEAFREGHPHAQPEDAGDHDGAGGGVQGGDNEGAATREIKRASMNSSPCSNQTYSSGSLKDILFSHRRM